MESAAHSWHQMQAHFVIKVQLVFRANCIDIQKKIKIIFLPFTEDLVQFSKWNGKKYDIVVFLLALDFEKLCSTLLMKQNT